MLFSLDGYAFFLDPDEARAKCPEALREVVVRLAQAANVIHLAVIAYDLEGAQRALLSTYPAAYSERASRDPAALEALRDIVRGASGPLGPEEWTRAAQASPAIARHLALRQLLDVGQYTVIPILRNHATVGALSIGHRAAVLDCDARRLLEMAAPTLYAALAAAGLYPTRGRLDLTPREIECVRLAARGLTAAETARALGVQPVTVPVHLRNAGAKLGASNKSHLVAIALQRGLGV